MSPGSGMIAACIPDTVSRDACGPAVVVDRTARACTLLDDAGGAAGRYASGGGSRARPPDDCRHFTATVRGALVLALVLLAVVTLLTVGAAWVVSAAGLFVAGVMQVWATGHSRRAHHQARTVGLTAPPAGGDSGGRGFELGETALHSAWIVGQHERRVGLSGRERAGFEFGEIGGAVGFGDGAAPIDLDGCAEIADGGGEFTGVARQWMIPFRTWVLSERDPIARASSNAVVRPLGARSGHRSPAPPCRDN